MPHSTFYNLFLFLFIYLFSFYLFNILLLANTKNIASDEEGPSWVLICIIQLFMGVRDLNEVYCLKTGLAAWPSCSSKNWLRNFQFWNCHDDFHSTVAQVFGVRGTVNNWLTTTVKQLALKCLGFHMPYALCICAVRPPLITSCTSRGLSGRRKPLRELAEPLEWIQPSLEIENRALTQLTLSQNLHNTAQDTKTTPGSSTLEELVVYISLPRFSMTQWYCNTWFNLQQ